MASIRIFCLSRFRHQSVEVTLIIFVLNDIDRFSVVSNLCKFCTSFFFCQLPILSQPDLAILHTDFNTVVTGILSENEEIDCTVTNGFSVFGRLAWNPDTSSSKIAEDWARMTFSNDKSVLSPVLKIMMMSRETYVNYTMPLGLNHIMNYDTHNGPEPWHDDPVWTAFDYHKITKDSIGVNRTAKGTGATRQYHNPVGEMFDDIKQCPQEYLLWFHRVPWNYKMASGRNLWDELVYHYYKGVDEVRQIQTIWNELDGKIDRERFEHVASLLKYQEQEAIWWRDGCLLFFQEYSRLPIPANLEQPKHSLKYYKNIPFPHDWKGLYK